MPGCDQSFDHSRIPGYKQHFKEAFYAGIAQSRAELQNSAISRTSLVTQPKSQQKTSTVLFSSKSIYGGVKAGNCTPLTKDSASSEAEANSYIRPHFSCMSGHLLDHIVDLPNPNTSWVTSAF